MTSKRWGAAPVVLLCCLALACALLGPPATGQDTADNTFQVPLLDTSVGANPLEVRGRVLLREVAAGPELEWSWGAKVSVKNVSDKPIALLVATLTELGRHPGSGRRGGLGDGPTYIMVEDRFFSDDNLLPSDSVILRDTQPGKLGEGCCVNPLDKLSAPEAEFKVLSVQFADGSIYGTPSAAAEAFARRRVSIKALHQLEESQPTDEKDFGEKLDGLCPSLGTICPRIAQALKKDGKPGAFAEILRFIALADKRSQMLIP
jgi:hypothetical protein